MALINVKLLMLSITYHATGLIAIGLSQIEYKTAAAIIDHAKCYWTNCNLFVTNIKIAVTSIYILQYWIHGN